MDNYKVGTVNGRVCCTAFVIENTEKREEGQGLGQLQGKGKCFVQVDSAYECMIIVKIMPTDRSLLRAPTILPNICNPM